MRLYTHDSTLAASAGKLMAFLTPSGTGRSTIANIVEIVVHDVLHTAADTVIAIIKKFLSKNVK